MVGYPERLGRLSGLAGVYDRTAVEHVGGHLCGGCRGLNAVVGEDFAVHVSAQHQHGEQGDEEE